MTKNQKIQNEKFFKNIILCSKWWIYPDALESYLITDDKKIQPETMRGYQIIKKLVRKEFFEQYVIAPEQ